jgi:hypothetical protein
VGELDYAAENRGFEDDNTPFQHPIWDILEAMGKYGGSFVKQLAKLYQTADPINRKTLERSFQDYFTRYDGIVTEELERKK